VPLAGLEEAPAPDSLFVERALARVLSPKAAQRLSEFLVFGAKEAASCVFAGSFLFLLAISSHVRIPGLARYDFLFLSAIRRPGQDQLLDAAGNHQLHHCRGIEGDFPHAAGRAALVKGAVNFYAETSF
jgi:hypothetical protein